MRQFKVHSLCIHLLCYQQRVSIYYQSALIYYQSALCGNHLFGLLRFALASYATAALYHGIWLAGPVLFWV